MPHVSHHGIQHEQNWRIQCSLYFVHWPCASVLQTSNYCKNASVLTFGSGLSSFYTPHQQLHSSVDHILTSAALVGLPALQRHKTITYIKACKVACSRVSGCDLDSNNVLDLGLDSKLRSVGRGRSTHFTGKLVPEMRFPVATFVDQSNGDVILRLEAGGLA